MISFFVVSCMSYWRMDFFLLPSFFLFYSPKAWWVAFCDHSCFHCQVQLMALLAWLAYRRISCLSYTTITHRACPASLACRTRVRTATCPLHLCSCFLSASQTWTGGATCTKGSGAWANQPQLAIKKTKYSVLASSNNISQSTVMVIVSRSTFYTMNIL